MKRILSASIWLSVSILAVAAPPLRAREHQAAKIKAAAIQVEMVQSDEIKLPAEFQIALYENLIRQLEKQGGSQHVYRDGDRNAKSVAERLAGATSIAVHCQFTNADGKSLLERDVNGKVLFFGGNLKATYDFAKKAAHVAHENFSQPDRE